MNAITPNGDTALLITLGTDISEQTLRHVAACTVLIDRLQKEGALEGVVECVPAYASVMVTFDLLQTDFFTLQALLQFHIKQLPTLIDQLPDLPVVDIPVCYDGEFALDIEALAAHCGLSVKEVVALHTAATYRVYMLGFMPGFLYLGGLDGRLHMPRKHTPRAQIPQGAVGIAGQQTGIYPLASPGGWQIIGRTPLSLFDAHQTPPTIAQPMQCVKFRAISLNEFDDMNADTVVSGNEIAAVNKP